VKDNQAHTTTKMDSIEKVRIGGIDQWISLRAQDTRNPPLLFLHGGPGTAQISFSRKSQRRLEKDYLVVNWDQRGAGRSYQRKLAKTDMTISRFVADCEELTEYLLQRFGQERIFLVGHSWGSIVGIKVAAKRPELLWSYIGIGQVIDMKRGEEVSYTFTLDEARRRNNQRAIRQLETIGLPPYKSLKDAGVQRNWLSKFNGSTFKGSIIGKILANVALRDLRVGDAVRFVQGAIFSLTCLEDEQMAVNIAHEISELKMPVYFCTGRRDYQVPFQLVVEFCDKLAAPTKQIVWFEQSAHLPNFEEPAAFCEFLSRIKAANFRPSVDA